MTSHFNLTFPKWHLDAHFQGWGDHVPASLKEEPGPGPGLHSQQPTNLLPPPDELMASRAGFMGMQPVWSHGTQCSEGPHR